MESGAGAGAMLSCPAARRSGAARAQIPGRTGRAAGWSGLSGCRRIWPPCCLTWTGLCLITRRRPQQRCVRGCLLRPRAGGHRSGHPSVVRSGAAALPGVAGGPDRLRRTAPARIRDFLPAVGQAMQARPARRRIRGVPHLLRGRLDRFRRRRPGTAAHRSRRPAGRGLDQWRPGPADRETRHGRPARSIWPHVCLLRAPGRETGAQGLSRSLPPPPSRPSPRVDGRRQLRPRRPRRTGRPACCQPSTSTCPRTAPSPPATPSEH